MDNGLYGASGRFEKVPLINLHVWARCPEAEATDWMAERVVGGTYVPSYPVGPVAHTADRIGRLYVITEPDGGLWKEASLYLYERTVELGKHSTAANIAGALVDFRNFLLDGGKDFRNFNGPKFERPTYYYKAHLKQQIRQGVIRKRTANRKISAVVGMYRWMAETRGFKPEQDMWISRVRSVTYLDRYGFAQHKLVVCTDLTFKVSAEINPGGYIEDGGKLYPITKENQDLLITALKNLENTEMLLIHIVALVTGMRMQSCLTIRNSDIYKGEITDDTRLIGIRIGEGAQADAKGGKTQTVLMPAWLHQQLAIYLSSVRYQTRVKNSKITNSEQQLVFLTKSGNPYYIPEKEAELYGFSAEAGSAIRQFKTKVNKELARMGKQFQYRMHDLRATFGMNLMDEHMKLLEAGKMNQLELLDMVKNRLNHSSVLVTMGYLKYRENNALISSAQSGYENHLRDIIKNENDRIKSLQTENPRS